MMEDKFTQPPYVIVVNDDTKIKKLKSACKNCELSPKREILVYCP